LKCKTCFEIEKEKTCEHVLTNDQNLQVKLNDMLIHCKNSQHGCPKILKLSLIEKHEKNDCEFEKLKCETPECQELQKNGELTHANTCGLYTSECKKCHKAINNQQVIKKKLMISLKFKLFYTISNNIFLSKHLKLNRIINFYPEKRS
jgi:hypothetical protein